MTTTTTNGGYDPATRTTRKFVYTATAPDGATLSRTSERSYPFAVAVYFAPRREYVHYGRVIPAHDGYWKVVSFHGTRKAAEKAGTGWSGTSRKIVIATTSVEKITRHR
jgi:hypothetical protein